MKRKEAERIVMSNLKGSKIKSVDTVTLAEAVREVGKSMKQGEMNKFFDVSHTMLQRINRINQLSEKTKEIVRESGFGIEKSYMLTQIPVEQEEKVAKAIIGMTAHDTRKFIKMLKISEKSIEECTKDLEAMQKTFSLVVIPMPESLYRQLLILARKHKKEPHDLALSILEEYIHEQS